MSYHEVVSEFGRITTDFFVCSGKPCIRGMRVTVAMIVEATAAGRGAADLLNDFPYLEAEDIREALSCAGALAQGNETQLVR